ncbi:MAG: class I SAM-dependent methyltransferase, partial [Deltaproteobacteria bacterium]|nr:class I SAM-dependent methyltransferase [Deltaproteobacteria bacterium]
ASGEKRKRHSVEVKLLAAQARDAGLGSGEVARLTDGAITAIDLMPEMIERAKASLEEKGFSDRVEVLQMDMNEMEFSDPFDLVWSEGAIYIMGFRNGLEKIKPLVRERGFVAVSEAVWLKPNPPEVVTQFWQEYPEIASVDEKLKVIDEIGYSQVGSFVLPAETWTSGYYDHLEKRANELEQEWQDIPQALTILQEARNEVAIFKQHSEYYGYCFFVMRKG